MTFSVIFNYQGDWDEKSKNVAEWLLVDARNEIINVTNPLLEQFNADWDELHPDITDMEDGSDEWHEYNKYIADRMNKVTSIYRSLLWRASGLLMMYDPDMDAELVVYNTKTKGKAFITLKEI